MIIEEVKENQPVDLDMEECGLFDGVSDMVSEGYIKGFHLNLMKRWFGDRVIKFEERFGSQTYGLDFMVFNSICASIGNFIVFCRSGDYVFGGYASKLEEG